MTDLNGGALFNAEFGIRHRGSTVPERSGVALSFCRRPLNPKTDNVDEIIQKELGGAHAAVVTAVAKS
ncbi:hypothetical protein GHO29_24815, partial [Pseudomonas helleri]|nr:hypothetical protein [Pseudomonas helleri]